MSQEQVAVKEQEKENSYLKDLDVDVENSNVESEDVVTPQDESLDDVANDTDVKKRELENALEEIDGDKDTYPSADKLFVKGHKFADTKERKDSTLDKYKNVLVNFTEAAKQCDGSVSNDLVSYLVEELDRRGAKKAEISKIENRDGKDVLVLDSAKVVSLVDEQTSAIEETKAVNAKEISETEELKSNTSQEELAKIYNTISQGKFRSFIDVLPMIIGKNGLFPSDEAVDEVLKGRLNDIKNAVEEPSDKKETKENTEVENVSESPVEAKESVEEQEAIKDVTENMAEVPNDKESIEKLAEEVENVSESPVEAKESVEEQEAIKDVAENIAEVPNDKESIEKLAEEVENVSENPAETKESVEEQEATKDVAEDVAEVPNDKESIEKLAEEVENVSESPAETKESVEENEPKTASDKEVIKKIVGNSKTFASNVSNDIKSNGSKREKFANSARHFSDFSKSLSGEDENAFISRNIKKIPVLKSVLPEEEDGGITNTVADVASSGFSALSGVSNVLADSSEISKKSSDAKNVQNQSVSILKSLKISDAKANSRKDDILKTMKGVNFSKKIVSPSQETKQKLAVPNAIDELQENPSYNVLPAEKKKLSIASAAIRSSAGMRYKKDEVGLNLGEDILSLAGNALDMVSVISPLIRNTGFETGLKIANIGLNVISKIYGLYSKKKASKIQKEKDQNIGSNVKNIMKVLYSVKDDSGELPTLQELDNTVVQNNEAVNGSKYKYSDQSSVSKIMQAQNAVSAYDLLAGSGVDIDGMMVAAIRANNAKISDGSSEENQVDLSKEGSTIDDYKLIILNRLANL